MGSSCRKLTLLCTFTKRYYVKRSCAEYSMTVLGCREVIVYAHANSLCAAAAAAAAAAAYNCCY
eukprot:16393-Heterococcus_DN1.PRE.2